MVPIICIIGTTRNQCKRWNVMLTICRRLVVSIRQSKPLTKFEKMWNSPCIAIEDPFELSHNLGAGISRKSMKDRFNFKSQLFVSVNLYIKKAFINGRRLFGTPLTSNPRGYRTVQVGSEKDRRNTLNLLLRIISLTPTC